MKTCKTNKLGQFQKATWYYFFYYPLWKIYRKFQNQLYHWDTDMFFPYIQRSMGKDRIKRFFPHMNRRRSKGGFCPDDIKGVETL